MPVWERPAVSVADGLCHPPLGCRVLGCRSLFGRGNGVAFKSELRSLWQTDFATPISVRIKIASIDKENRPRFLLALAEAVRF